MGRRYRINLTTQSKCLWRWFSSLHPKVADEEALLTFVIPTHASYLCSVLDEQKVIHEDMEENLTTQATSSVHEESDDVDDPNDRNAFMDYVDSNISTEWLKSNVSAVKLVLFL